MRRALPVAAALLAASALSGCMTLASLARAEREAALVYDPSEYAWYAKGGAGVLEGSAASEDDGGGRGTCAGGTVWLVPEGRYTQAVTTFLGSEDGEHGRRAGSAHRSLGELWETRGDGAPIRTTTCDAQGRFRFDALAPGPYFVQATAASPSFAPARARPYIHALTVVPVEGSATVRLVRRCGTYSLPGRNGSPVSRTAQVCPVRDEARPGRNWLLGY